MNPCSRWSWFLACALSLSGCSSSAPEAPAAPVALVEVQPAATRTLSETLSAYGTAEFASADAASLSVQVESQVAQVLVTAGTEVKRGQALLQLAPSATSRLDFGKARRDADVTAAERDRLKRLRSEGLATESDLQNAINAAATAAATRDSLVVQLGARGMQTLRAPRDGIVDSLAVQPGDVLAPGTVAVRISAPDNLQVRLGVEPEDAGLLAAGQAVTLAPLGAAATTVSANIFDVDRRIDPLTRLVAALVRLPPRSGVLPGAALRADIVVAQHANVVTVPRTALLYTGEQAYLFVARERTAQRREIKTGVRDGETVEITEGLKSGESVIVAGNAVLEDGMAIRMAAADQAPKAVDTGQKP